MFSARSLQHNFLFLFLYCEYFILKEKSAELNSLLLRPQKFALFS